MRILQLASEATPFAKTGGLADVVSALCRELGARGHEVALFLPLYRAIPMAGYRPGRKVLSLPIGSPDANEVCIRRLGAGSGGVDVLGVDAPGLFNREGLYGSGGQDYADNGLRFATYVRASLAASVELGLDPEIVHCHDWQAALAAVLLRVRERAAHGVADRAPLSGPLPTAPGTVLTIHNLAYQGVFPAATAVTAGLGNVLSATDVLEHHGRISYLKGGIVCADRVTTVSPRYAREITTPEFGFGLQHVLAALEPPVTGISNGIDTEVWNPEQDPFVPARYNAGDQTGKAVCKASLQAEFGLPTEPRTPLFGLVSRLVDQKGLGLLEELGSRLGGWEAQFVMLGTGEPRYERLLRELAQQHPNVASRIAFSEPLAHLIEAGSDFFLMPSAFEPCGLNQMISQRYGTLPVVHRIGGLADSVVHISPRAIRDGTATGIVFDYHDAAGLSWAIDTALALYRDAETMVGVVRTAMARDFSWSASVTRYERLYGEVVAGDRSASAGGAKVSGVEPGGGS